MYRVEFYVEDCCGTPIKRVIDTHKDNVNDAYSVAIQNGHNPMKNIRFIWIG